MSSSGPQPKSALPAYLIVPLRLSEAEDLARSPGAMLWEGARVDAFADWEEAAAESRRRWRKKTHFLIFDSFALQEEQVAIKMTNGGFSLEGDIPRRAAVNLGLPTRRQVSAGGVVRCPSSSGGSLALIQVERRGIGRWEIPKGKMRRRESPREAALREVREEIGIQVPLTLRQPIGRIDYLFQAENGRLYFKSVLYYLIEAEEEAPLRPREEEGIVDARWFPLENACEIVSFPNLRPILRRAARPA